MSGLIQDRVLTSGVITATGMTAGAHPCPGKTYEGKIHRREFVITRVGPNKVLHNEQANDGSTRASTTHHESITGTAKKGKKAVKKDLNDYMFSVQKEIEVYVCVERGHGNESATGSICVDLKQYCAAHRLTLDSFKKVLKRNFGYWSVNIGTTQKPQFVDVCGLIGVMEGFGYFNLRIEYSIWHPVNTVFDVSVNTATGTVKKEFVGTAHISNGVFGLMWDYLIACVGKREANSAPVSAAAVETETAFNLEVAEQRIRVLVDANRTYFDAQTATAQLVARLTQENAVLKANMAKASSVDVKDEKSRGLLVGMMNNLQKFKGDISAKGMTPDAIVRCAHVYTGLNMPALERVSTQAGVATASAAAAAAAVTTPGLYPLGGSTSVKKAKRSAADAADAEPDSGMRDSKQ